MHTRVAAFTALVSRWLCVSFFSGKRPFLRSLYLTPFLLSGILSVYKLSFVKVDNDPTSYVFAVFGQHAHSSVHELATQIAHSSCCLPFSFAVCDPGMLLNLSIIGVVFNPAAELAGAVAEA